MKLKSNLKAPNFKLPSTGKTIFELNKFKKNIILYFYPKDDTPGCTIEAKDFSKLNSLISKNKTCVFGISKDSIESHLKFKKKYKLKFDLLSRTTIELNIFEELFSILFVLIPMIIVCKSENLFKNISSKLFNLSKLIPANAPSGKTKIVF